MSFDVECAKEEYRKEHNLPYDYPLSAVQWPSGGAILDALSLDALPRAKIRKILSQIQKNQKEEK